MDRFATHWANLGADKAVMVLAFVNPSIECEVDNARLCDLIQHVPRNVGVWDVGLQIDVGDRTAGALCVKNCAKPQLLLNGALSRQRNPLVRIDESILNLKQRVIFLAQNNSGTLCGNRLDVEGVLVSEVVLDVIQNIEDLACELDTLIGIVGVTSSMMLYIFCSTFGSDLL